MANYKTHSVFNIFLALPILLAAIFYLLHPTKALVLTFIATFVYGTLFMSPDLDLANKIKLFSLRGILTLPFRGYAQIFRHRGISHSVIFGSATRILWIAGLSLLVFYLIYSTLPSEKEFLLFYRRYRFYFFYGLAGITLADWSHLLLDFEPRFSKKRK